MPVHDVGLQYPMPLQCYQSIRKTGNRELNPSCGLLEMGRQATLRSRLKVAVPDTGANHAIQGESASISG